MGLSVRWTPDGRYLFILTGDRFQVGSQSYTLIQWDTVAGKALSITKIPSQLKGVTGQLNDYFTHFLTGAAIDFSLPSGRLVTLGGDNTAIIWDQSYQTPKLVLTGHSDAVNSVAWSPDGTRLATASQDSTARIWDGQTGKTLLVLQGHTGRVNQALWSLDGKYLVTAGEDGTARIWDAQSGELVRKIEPNAGVVWTLAWSPDGSRLVTGQDDGSLRFWDVAIGKLLVTLRGHQGLITSLVWSPTDQRLASADSQGGVRIWNAAISTALLTMPYVTTEGYFDFTKDGQYVAVSSGRNFPPVEAPALSIWDIHTSKRVVEQLSLSHPNFWYRMYYASNDKTLLAVGSSAPWPVLPSQAYVFDAWSGETLQTFDAGTDNWIQSVAWSPDDSQVATGLGNKGEIIIWDYRTGKPVIKLVHNDTGKMINCIRWSPNGTRLVSASDDSTAKVWDTRTWKPIFTLPHEPPTAVSSAAWSPDGSRILTGAGNDDTGAKDNTARVWDSATGKLLLTNSGHTHQIWTVDWSPNGTRVVTASADGTIRIWDASTGAELLNLSIPAQYMSFVRWSPDGQHLATGAGGSSPALYRIWQSTQELLAYAKQCCVIRQLTPQERKQFGLQ
jgi:WD40 repeat protein